jgi:hypothetical protein
MMNGYEKAQSLGLTGTAEEKAAVLRTITATPIRLEFLMEVLNFRGMLRKTDGSGGTERWQGTLQAMKAALVSLGMTQYVESYELWFSHVTNPRQVSWNTAQPEFATAFALMEQNFADQPGMPTSADFEAVAALGGGRPYRTITAQDLIDQEQAAIEMAAKDAALQIVQNAMEAAREEYRKPNSTPQTILAAAVAVLEAA